MWLTGKIIWFYHTLVTHLGLLLDIEYLAVPLYSTFCHHVCIPQKIKMLFVSKKWRFWPCACQDGLICGHDACLRWQLIFSYFSFSEGIVLSCCLQLMSVFVFCKGASRRGGLVWCVAYLWASRLSDAAIIPQIWSLAGFCPGQAFLLHYFHFTAWTEVIKCAHHPPGWLSTLFVWAKWNFI